MLRQRRIPTKQETARDKRHQRDVLEAQLSTAECKILPSQVGFRCFHPEALQNMQSLCTNHPAMRVLLRDIDDTLSLLLKESFTAPSRGLTSVLLLDHFHATAEGQGRLGHLFTPDRTSPSDALTQKHVLLFMTSGKERAECIMNTLDPSEEVSSAFTGHPLLAPSSTPESPLLASLHVESRPPVNVLYAGLFPMVAAHSQLGLQTVLHNLSGCMEENAVMLCCTWDLEALAENACERVPDESQHTDPLERWTLKWEGDTAAEKAAMANTTTAAITDHTRIELEWFPTGYDPGDADSSLSDSTPAAAVSVPAATMQWDASLGAFNSYSIGFSALCDMAQNEGLLHVHSMKPFRQDAVMRHQELLSLLTCHAFVRKGAHTRTPDASTVDRDRRASNYSSLTERPREASAREKRSVTSQHNNNSNGTRHEARNGNSDMLYQRRNISDDRRFQSRSTSSSSLSSDRPSFRPLSGHGTGKRHKHRG